MRSRILFLLITLLAATILTGFYFVHENLPRAVRAPTSLILSPVAIADGLCYMLGLPGVYGKPVQIFVVNWLASAIVGVATILALRLRSRGRGRGK
jgi:hypothetical protein